MPKEFSKRVKDDGYSLDKGFLKIGVLLDDAESSQLNYSCILSANKYLEESFGANISLFLMHHTHKCLTPKFAVFNARDIRGYNGNIIATSAKTLLETKKCFVAKKFYYLYDLVDFLKNQAIIIEYVKNNEVTVFTRADDYLKKIEDLITVKRTIVKDCNFQQIINIVLGKD